MPDSPATADTLGWAHYKKGSYKSAIGYFDESLKKAPDNPTYHYHLGLAYVADGQVNEGKESLKKALSLNPGFAYAASARQALENLP